MADSHNCKLTRKLRGHVENGFLPSVQFLLVKVFVSLSTKVIRSGVENILTNEDWTFPIRRHSGPLLILFLGLHDGLL